jgi:hypothetical protein
MRFTGYRSDLDRARRVFENGNIVDAARILAQVSARADQNYDEQIRGDVADYTAQMRSYLSGESLARFDQALAEAEAPTEGTAADEVAFSSVGLALAGVGAALMVVSVFLPHVDSKTFARVGQNTLIQSGEGWVFVGLAIGIAATTYRAYHRSSRTIVPCILGASGVASAIYAGVARIGPFGHRRLS